MTDDLAPNVIEPAHGPDCPPDCSDRFWASVDSHASVVIVVVDANGTVRGTFTDRVRATQFAISTGVLCTLIPQALDTPEWGNVPLH